MKELTSTESSEIIREHILEDEQLILNFKNHRKHDLRNKKNTFRFTLDIISLDFLNSLSKDSRIKNVYFNPSIPPPGGSLDSLSLRYKIYVEYYESKTKRKKKLKNEIS